MLKNKSVSIESKMTKALVIFSQGRLSYERASKIAKKAAPIFGKASMKNQVLVHKGLNWYAKELLKAIECEGL